MNPASPSLALNSGSQPPSHESTAGDQPNSVRSARRNSRDRRPQLGQFGLIRAQRRVGDHPEASYIAGSRRYSGSGPLPPSHLPRAVVRCAKCYKYIPYLSRQISALRLVESKRGWMTDVVSIGTYLPPWSSGDRRVKGPDEDALTMAVAAGRAADPGASAQRVVMVSRDFPLLEGGNGAVLLAGLSLGADVPVAEVLGGAPAVLDQARARAAGHAGDRRRRQRRRGRGRCAAHGRLRRPP